MEQKEIRRRTLRVEVKQTRQAVSAAAPVSSRIGSMQALVARINALASRPLSLDRRRALLAEALALAEAVAHERELLDKAVEDLSPAVAGNGRILDTRRALDNVDQSVERSLGLLGHTGARARPTPQNLSV